MNADGKQSVIYNVLPVKHYWQVHLQVCRLPIIILFFFPMGCSNPGLLFIVKQVSASVVGQRVLDGDSQDSQT